MPIGVFKLVKAFNTPEKPQTFDVRSLCPGEDDQTVADKLTFFFNRISSEFDPLSPEEIPKTADRRLDPLSPHEVSLRLRRFRKPRSMVAGDLFPDLVTKHADFLALPLTDLYNKIAASGVWPSIWKTEHVTVIPKCLSPQSFGDLRNISCTMLFSKVMESFVFEWAEQEVTVKNNQYGGVKGCSRTYLIIKVWDKIMRNLEDRRAATVLTSIDYVKAFNWLSFQHCLAAFAKRGASTQIIGLLASFLTGRTMTVRVGSSWSSPRHVTGRCPQGSILGVFLFNLTTDDLEDDSAFVSEVERPDPVGVGGEEEDEDFYGGEADEPGCDAMGPESPVQSDGSDQGDDGGVWPGQMILIFCRGWVRVKVTAPSSQPAPERIACHLVLDMPGPGPHQLPSAACPSPPLPLEPMEFLT